MLRWGGIPESYANSVDYRVVGPLTLTNVKGKTLYAKVESSDRGRDLAVLRLCDEFGGEIEDRLPGYLHLADAELVGSVSDASPRHVFAVGYPKGTVCVGPPAFTDGKAESVFNRSYANNGEVGSFETILNYTNTKCGYSGGPLVDYETGTVIGINFGGLIERDDGHKAGSFATSSNEAVRGFLMLKR